MKSTAMELTDTAIHFCVLIAIVLLIFVCYIQGNTIEQQKYLIREMMKNPQCLVPETPKQPAMRRGRFV